LENTRKASLENMKRAWRKRSKRVWRDRAEKGEIASQEEEERDERAQACRERRNKGTPPHFGP